VLAAIDAGEAAHRWGGPSPAEVFTCINGT
jgi:hypothetical protein